MKRRDFLTTAGRAAAGALLGRSAWGTNFGMAPPGSGDDSAADAWSFTTQAPDLQRVYDAALAALRGNVVKLGPYPDPVLIEGSVYRGVWLECGPQEGEVDSVVGTEGARAAARNNQLVFFALQKPDGQLPCSVKDRGPGFGQIQMVVPIAATAWELARRWGDEELLHKAYAACGKWDAWLRRYRNTRGTGLCEGFCTYDTGMDNSPRWRGVPNACPDGDARKCPDAPGVPRLCPDLSATVYGGRVALAAMAKALEKQNEAGRWEQDAATIRKLIVERLYDPEDAAFYDLDSNNQFVKVRSTATLRVLGEHVVDGTLFETIWRKQVHNPDAFWAPYPFPSAALNDPTFVRPIPRNSWGGASQALTALRAPRWMEHYGKPSDLGFVMQRWLEALLRAGEFRQQMDPVTGDFTMKDPGGYSPAALVFCDFLWRLSGVREQDGLVEWNVRPPAVVGQSKFTRTIGGTTAELRYEGTTGELWLGGRRLARVDGRVRLLGTRTGELREAVGIANRVSPVTLFAPDQALRVFAVEGNARMPLTLGKG
jgi:hypothetical protein